MYVEVFGLPPGPHGIHLHATGSCSPNFKAATGHINDHLSQPIGDAGGRIACGVITIVRDCQEGCRGAQPGSGHPRHRWRAIHPAMQRSTQLPQIV